jgi:hypothetical protein
LLDQRSTVYGGGYGGLTLTGPRHTLATPSYGMTARIEALLISTLSTYTIIKENLSYLKSGLIPSA